MKGYPGYLSHFIMFKITKLAKILTLYITKYSNFNFNISSESFWWLTYVNHRVNFVVHSVLELNPCWGMRYKNISWFVDKLLWVFLPSVRNPSSGAFLNSREGNNSVAGDIVIFLVKLISGTLSPIGFQWTFRIKPLNTTGSYAAHGRALWNWCILTREHVRIGNRSRSFLKQDEIIDVIIVIFRHLCEFSDT